jgi:hypothetical protein
MGKRIRNQGGESVSLLATTFVVALGGGAVFFLMLMVNPDKTPAGGTVIGVVTVAFLAIVAIQRISRARTDGMSFWLIAGRSHREDGIAANYMPRRASSSRTPAAGTVNKPISVDEVREIQSMSANTWVPTSQKRRAKDRS